MKNSILIGVIFLLGLLPELSAREVCGETLNLRFSYNEKKAQLLSTKLFEEKFCEKESKFMGANIEILFTDGDGKIIQRKYEYFPMKHISHQEKNGKMIDAAVLKWEDFANVKIPLDKKSKSIKKFRINGLDGFKYASSGDVSL